MSMPEKLKRELADKRRERKAAAWEERRRRDEKDLARSLERNRARTQALGRRYFALKAAGHPRPAATVLEELARARRIS